MKQYPSDTLIQQIIAPQTLAMVALDEHKPDEAIRQLEINRPYDLASPGAYLRGLAYLQAGDSANAILLSSGHSNIAEPRSLRDIRSTLRPN